MYEFQSKSSFAFLVVGSFLGSLFAISSAFADPAVQPSPTPSALPFHGSRPTDLYKEATALRGCPQGTPECFAKATDLYGRYIARRSNFPFIYSQKTYTKNVAVLVHSYTIEPEEMRKWALILNARGFNVIAPVLEAHSPDGIAMMDVKAEDWENDVRFALDIAHQIGQNVLLMGYSLGGLLTVESDIKYPKEIHAIALVAPAVGINIPLASLSCVGKQLIQTHFAAWVGRQVGIPVDDYIQEFVEGACPLREIIFQIDRSMPYGMVDSNNAESGPHSESYESHMDRVYSQIKTPTFMIYTDSDEIVDPNVEEQFLENISVKATVVHFDEKQPIGHLGINYDTLTNTKGQNTGAEFAKWVEQTFEINKQ